MRMDRKCSNCGTVMKDMGNMKFRIGGYSGIGGMFLGGWNQLAEDTKTFDLMKCDSCGKIDFYEPTP